MQTPGSNRKGGIISYTALCLAVTFAGSLVTPVLSFFLSRELHFSDTQISLIFVILPITTIAVVQTFGKLSDGFMTRPIIVCIACIAGAIAPLFLITRPNYLLFCTLEIFFLSIYPSAFTQVFASAREYATKYLDGSVMYQTFLRAMVSLSWVVGPPIAYYISTTIDFNTLFYICASVYTLALVLAFFFLPHYQYNKAKNLNHADNKYYKNKDVIFLFIAIAGLFTAFLSYIISMPLYLTNELNFIDKAPGYLMSVCAFIEIPLMFLSTRFIKHLGIKKLVITGALSLSIFLVLMFNLKTLEGFILAQFFAALFIALVSNLGMIFFQELLPTIPGQATSLYINACTTGQIAGGALISISSFGSYKYIFLAGIGVAFVSTLILCLVRAVHKKV